MPTNNGKTGLNEDTLETNNFSAADLKTGEKGIVARIVGDESIKQRLGAMGVIAGTVINAPMTSAFGNPRTYMVRGSQLCMRTNEAMMILLEKDVNTSNS